MKRNLYCPSTYLTQIIKRLCNTKSKHPNSETQTIGNNYQLSIGKELIVRFPNHSTNEAAKYIDAFDMRYHTFKEKVQKAKILKVT